MEEGSGPSRGRARARGRAGSRAMTSSSETRMQIGEGGPRSSDEVSDVVMRSVEDEPRMDEYSEEAQLARYEQFMRQRDYLRTRPDYLVSKLGAGGRAISLISNYFALQIRKMDEWRLNQYRVDFIPDQDSKKIRKALFRKLEIENFKYIYDGGHMIFSNSLLDVNPTVKEVAWIDNKGQEIPHTIAIRHVKALTWDDNAVLQFYNILVRKSLEAIQLELMGRYYYDHTLKASIPQFRLEVWPGYKTVMRPHEKSVFLNVEMVSKVIQTSTVLQNMQEIRNSGTRDVQQAITDAICNRVVMTEFNRKTYHINNIAWDKRVTDTFETKKGPITFIDYYKNRYGLIIQDTKQPLLVSLPKKRDFHRGDTSEILLVPELCLMTGLTDDMRQNFQLMKELKTKLIQEPMKRADQLQTFMKRLVDCESLREELLGWGVRYPNNSMVAVPGRVLEPEKMLFGNGQEFQDQQNPADWTMAFRSKKLFQAVPCPKWAVICPTRESNGLDNLVKTMQRVATPLGYIMGNPNRKIISGTQGRNYLEALETIMRESNGRVDIIFIILPNNNAQLYSTIKQKCAVEYGVLSQCFLSKNAAKANMSVCTKVVIQMAAKQGGEPWSVLNPMAKGNLMVVGFDVYHGGPNDRGGSVGAMVASINPALTKYTSMVTMGQRTELSGSMGSDFLKLIEKYAQANGSLPSRIIFYRDGVGEGQLGQVLDLEVSGIQNSLKARYGRDGIDPPKFTFIVVSKRINTRFMWTTHHSCENPPPGTVVDDVVTLPERYDFFLVSQVARQGTISPTSYNVIVDHPSLQPKQIQMFSYKMCHMYFNWSGTVSVPAPCQYAHKLAYLTGLALINPAHANLSNLLHFL